MAESPLDSELVIGTLKAPWVMRYLREGGIILLMALFIFFDSRQSHADSKDLREAFDLHQTTMVSAVMRRETFEANAQDSLRTMNALLRQLCVNTAHDDRQRDACLSVK